MAHNPQNKLLIQIYDLIEDYFDLEEFRDLCFRLGVKYDHLRGENLPARIRDLVEMMHRRRRLNDLLNFCSRLRPRVEWPDLPDSVSLGAAPAPVIAPKRNPRQIFLSHARQDADFAHRLAADLRRHEWEVWIAPDSIRSGEGWVAAINRGLAESGIFLLALTPDAVNSKWVHSETDVAIDLEHNNLLRFIPLDLKPATVPPLWRRYQWISFQSDYKAGLEELLGALQPEKIRPLARLYRQMQDAIGRRDWAQVQKLGSEINNKYPDYRETEMLMAMARKEDARDQRQQAESRAQREQEEIHRQQQNRLNAFSQTLRRVPVWGWIGGAVVVAALFGLFQLASGWGDDNVTVVPTEITAAISQITPETPTISPTPQPTDTQQPTNTAIPSPTHTATPKATNTPTITPVPTPGIGSTRIRPADGTVMVYVPEGTFLMGSDDGQDDEKPVHAVDLDAYWIDQTEVTNAQFAQFVDATGYETTAEQEGTGYAYADGSWDWLDGADWQHPSGPDSSLDGKDAHPVVQVSWHDAVAYCKWAGSRLPTEAEWEKAAKGTDERVYPWSNEFACEKGNFDDETVEDDYVVPGDEGCDGYVSTAPVGSFPDGASPYGAFDIAGNVWEWTADRYDSDYYQNSPSKNPQGSDSGDTRVMRGGSSLSLITYVRAANRGNDSPTDRVSNLGFRCTQE